MTAKGRPRGLAPPVEVMSRLHSHGYSLLPLGGGEDGKSPLLPFSAKPRIGLPQVLGPMYGKGSACYGIRLDGLLVIDCDEDSDGLVKTLEARFGASPVHVVTPRGRHMYYASGARRLSLRGEGLPVDVKTGASSYVVGPGSVRPDGGEYVMVKGDLCEDQLHPLKEPETPRQAALVSPCIEIGERNRALTQMAVALAGDVAIEEELAAALIGARDARCEKPETMPDTEVLKIARWAWNIRCENRLYQERDSEFRLHRRALGRLKGQPGAEDAIALYIVLTDLHGHSPGKTFALSHKGMRDAGHVTISERRFLTARKLLESVHLLEVAAPAVRGTRHQSFRLLRPLEHELDRLRAEGKEGGSF